MKKSIKNLVQNNISGDLYNVCDPDLFNKEPKALQKAKPKTHSAESKHRSKDWKHHMQDGDMYLWTAARNKTNFFEQDVLRIEKINPQNHFIISSHKHVNK